MNSSITNTEFDYILHRIIDPDIFDEESELIDYFRKLGSNESEYAKRVAMRNAIVRCIKNLKTGEGNRQPSHKVRHELNKYYKNYSGIVEPYNKHQKKLGKVFWDERNAIDSYVGKHRFFMLGAENNCYSGEFKIYSEDHVYRYELTIKYEKQKTFDGVLYFVGDRLYSDGIGSYLTRPLLIEFLERDQLEKEPIFGICMGVKEKILVNQKLRRPIYGSQFMIIHEQNNSEEFKVFENEEAQEYFRLRNTQYVTTL